MKQKYSMCSRRSHGDVSKWCTTALALENAEFIQIVAVDAKWVSSKSQSIQVFSLDIHTVKGLLGVSHDLEEDPDGDLQTPNH